MSVVEFSIDNCAISGTYTDGVLSSISVSGDRNVSKTEVDELSSQINSMISIVSSLQTQYAKRTSSKLSEDLIDSLVESKMSIHKSAYEKEIELLTRQLSAMQTIVDSTSKLDVINDIHSIVSTKFGSAERGQIGENLIADAFREFSMINSDIHLDDTSGVTGHGDLIVKYKDASISIEVKNYKTSIPINQIQKFNKAMESDVYNAGIFISINTGFSSGCKLKPFDIKRVNGKPVVYLSHFEYKNRHVLMMAINAITLILNNDESATDLDTYVSYVSQSLEDIDEMNKLIEAQSRNLDKMQKQMTKMKKRAIALTS